METTLSPSSAVETKPELMTVKELAEYLRIPTPTIYYLVQRGKLPGAIQIGGRWRIKRSVIDRDVLKNEIPCPLAVCLKINDRFLDTLVRWSLSQTTAPHELEISDNAPKAIITDLPASSAMKDFKGIIIRIVDDVKAPDVQDSLPWDNRVTTYISLENIIQDVRVLRRILGLPK